MKIQGWLILVMGLIGFVYGCGRDQATSPFQEMLPAPSTSAIPQMMDVSGFAAFGNQCPYGSYVPPSMVPVELWDCPLNVSTVELAQPLPSLILQADCKKKTLDVRSEDRAISAVTWEVMPDGNFYMTFNAGTAKLKSDGAGHSNCQVPMVASMWGHIDCKDRDKATIRVETVWRLGTTLTAEPGTGPSPSPSPSPSHSLWLSEPSGMPSVFPSAVASPLPGEHPATLPSRTPVAGTPTGNSSSEEPEASASSAPWPSPSHSTSRANHPSAILGGVGANAPIPNSSGPKCQVPSGCYFHVITKMEQCS